MNAEARRPDVHCDTCIIGGGPAGLTLADALNRQGARVVVLESATDWPDPDADTLSRQTCRYPIEHALHDGEDYELLFTTREEQPFGYWIGTVTAGPDIVDEDRTVSMEPKGWEHKL